MVLMVLETEALADGALPVQQLAANMRLADGYAAVPGQEERLRLRLRAAIGAIERRLGRVLIDREVVLTGSGGSDRIAVPVRPVNSLVLVEEIGAGPWSAVAGARLEEDATGVALVLPGAPSDASRLRVVVRAGYGAWDDVPSELGQAVLGWAEALDLGEPVPAEVERLLGPWRLLRLGGRI